ncbi:MAG: hypothetical protein ACOC4S_01605 [Balneolaceae bacterium]
MREKLHQNKQERTRKEWGRCILIGIIVLTGALSEAKGQAVLGARAVALGQTSVALAASEWALFANPSILEAGRSSAAFYGFRYYGFAEITDMAAVVNHATGIGMFAAGVHRYGFDLFNESRYRLGYKYHTGDFHYGAALTYHHVVQGGGYGSVGAVGVDLGLAVAIGEQLWFGARTTNVNRPRYGNVEEDLPRDLAIGMSYDAGEKVIIISELVKDVRFPVSYRGGIEVTIMNGLTGRAGITTEPVTFSMGFGYRRPGWGVNIAAQRHELLGMSPGFDLNLTL